MIEPSVDVYGLADCDLLDPQRGREHSQSPALVELVARIATAAGTMELMASLRHVISWPYRWNAELYVHGIGGGCQRA